MRRILTTVLFMGLAFSVGAFACDEQEAAQLSQRAVEMLAANPTRACFNSSDCLVGENCINGQCVFGRCLSDIDCAIGEHCVAGTCRR